MHIFGRESVVARGVVWTNDTTTTWQRTLGCLVSGALKAFYKTVGVRNRVSISAIGGTGTMQSTVGLTLKRTLTVTS